MLENLPVVYVANLSSDSEYPSTEGHVIFIAYVSRVRIKISEDITRNRQSG
jgi:hypothetical protein